jgi:ribose/xylose/arabinose/galactoside ABC-type transport system permease subunit
VPAGSGSRAWVRLVAPLVVLAVLSTVFAVTSKGRFLTPDSLGDIGRQAAIFVVVGVGQTLIIVSGGIDLSVGSVVAFTGTLAAVLMLEHGASPAAAAAAAVLAGGAIGFLNGLLSVKARLHPFIITLGSMMIFRGLALSLTEARNTPLLPPAFAALATGEFPLGSGRELVVPHILVVYMSVVAIAAHLMLTRTRAGRYCFAIGSNPESARLSGIRVSRWIILYFVLAGLLFGFGGVIQAARIRIGQPTGSEGMELEAIAAAVIGGTSLSGGEGSIAGTVLGALLMAALRQGLRMLGLPPYWQTVSLGVAIVIAVVYDRATRRGAGRRG